MYKPGWFLERNPLGKVPTVQIDNAIIYESLIVNDYIEEAYPEPALSPKNPKDRAHDRVLVEANFESAIGIFFKLLKSKDPNLNRAELTQKLQRRMAIFEKELSKRNTTYFFSDEQPGLLDFNIWPWFERLDVFPIAYPEIGTAVLPNDKFPLLNKWIDEMKNNAIVRKSFLDTPSHLRFLMSLRDGNPIYDPDNNRPWLSKL